MSPPKALLRLIERGAAVDDDEVVRGQRLHLAAQSHLPTGPEFLVEFVERFTRRRDVDLGASALDDVVERHTAVLLGVQHVEHRGRRVTAVGRHLQAQSGGGVALRIHVDEQHADRARLLLGLVEHLQASQFVAQVHRGGGLVSPFRMATAMTTGGEFRARTSFESLHAQIITFQGWGNASAAVKNCQPPGAILSPQVKA